jgi:8-oxo-dGTP pyrophosphatase MutT (NUDIX family)
MTAVAIHRVTTLALTVAPWRWPFAQARRAEIDAYYARARREKPRLWNGRVLLGRQPTFEGSRLSASYFETDFASLLAWRDWGFPDRAAFNGFGMGALRCADGAFVLGEMSSHTANAGRIYFPAGTPDPDDVSDGMLDLAASVARETEEETGLKPADYRAAPYWDCVVTGATIAMIRTLHVDMAGEALRASIEANLSRQAHPELAALHLIRTRSDLNGRMPSFVTAFLGEQLSC